MRCISKAVPSVQVPCSSTTAAFVSRQNDKAGRAASSAASLCLRHRSNCFSTSLRSTSYTPCSHVRAFSSSSSLWNLIKKPGSTATTAANAEASASHATKGEDKAGSASMDGKLAKATAPPGEHTASSSTGDIPSATAPDPKVATEQSNNATEKQSDATETPSQAKDAADEKNARETEEKEKEEEEEDVRAKRRRASEDVERAGDDADTSTPEAKSKVERLLDADKSLRIEEVFSQDQYQQFIHTTEVSTTEGLRWLDVSASPEFFKDPLMAHVPEGQFAYSVMRKLFGSRFPIGVYASVASGAALPATYMDENWACLILRSTKEALRRDDDVVGLIASDRRHGRHHRSPSGGSSGGRGQLGHRRHWRLATAGKRWHDAPQDYDVDAAYMRAGDAGDYVYDDATDSYYPREAKPLQRWAQMLERRLKRSRQARAATAAAAAASSSTSGKSSSSSSAKADTQASLRRYRTSSSSYRGRSSYRSPLTMADFTDRLTVFIGKELHPVEEDPDAPPATAASSAEGKVSPVLSLDMDRLYAETHPTKTSNDPSNKEVGTGRSSAHADDTKDSARSSSSPSSAAAATENGKPPATRYEVRWRVITVHRSPISFIRDMQSQWNKLTSRNGRPVRSLRTVPANHHSTEDTEEIIKQALRRAARPPSMVEEEEEEDDRDDAYNTMVDRVTGWEDLVRLLYHGAARTLQESAYRNTRRLELMETEIFETSDNSAQHLRAMTRLMAELHLLSRKATIHNAILRESKVAYQKLKRSLDHPIDLADERELLYVDSVLSISAHLEEQSESLLFLQFSVAMNQTEQHLRTLTIFSTLFIPLDFIVTCCGSNITSLQGYNHSKTAMYAVFGVMATTAVMTFRWIRRTLR